MTPPMRKLKNIAEAEEHRHLKRIFAFQKVPERTRKMKPVGMEISSVVSMNSGRMSGLMPLWNRWCCHTKNESNATPSMPAAATL